MYIFFLISHLLQNLVSMYDLHLQNYKQVNKDECKLKSNSLTTAFFKEVMNARVDPALGGRDPTFNV